MLFSLYQVVSERGWLFSTTISNPHHHHVFPKLFGWRATSKARKDAIRFPSGKINLANKSKSTWEELKFFSTTHLSSKPILAHNNYLADCHRQKKKKGRKKRLKQQKFIPTVDRLQISPPQPHIQKSPNLGF